MEKGFTLVELLVVLVILGAITGIIAPLVIRQSDEYQTAEEAQTFVEPAPPEDPQKEIVEQLKKQNELLERQLKIQEAGLPAEKQ